MRGSGIYCPATSAAAPATSTSSPRCAAPPSFSDERNGVAMSTRMFGARIERNIDPKLLRGEGAFVDDIPLTGVLHAAFLRSPHARARIKRIDTSAAKARVGVVAVYTCDDIGTLDTEMPLLITHPSMTNPQAHRPL